MTEFRIIFTTQHGVNIETKSREEVESIVKAREWEYGMDWDEGEVEIDSVEEI